MPEAERFGLFFFMKVLKRKESCNDSRRLYAKGAGAGAARGRACEPEPDGRLCRREGRPCHQRGVPREGRGVPRRAQCAPPVRGGPRRRGPLRDARALLPLRPDAALHRDHHREGHRTRFRRRAGRQPAGGRKGRTDAQRRRDRGDHRHPQTGGDGPQRGLLPLL